MSALSVRVMATAVNSITQSVSESAGAAADTVMSRQY